MTKSGKEETQNNRSTEERTKCAIIVHLSIAKVHTHTHARTPLPEDTPIVAGVANKNQQKRTRTWTRCRQELLICLFVWLIGPSKHLIIPAGMCFSSIFSSADKTLRLLLQSVVRHLSRRRQALCADDMQNNGGRGWVWDIYISPPMLKHFRYILAHSCTLLVFHNPFFLSPSFFPVACNILITKYLLQNSFRSLGYTFSPSFRTNSCSEHNSVGDLYVWTGVKELATEVKV